MLNPMIRWEPGTTVRYHGSLTDLHGNYQAHRCGCSSHADERHGVRFSLLDQAGVTVVTCVRPSSITPADTFQGAAR